MVRYKSTESTEAQKASLNEIIAAKALCVKELIDHKKTALNCELQRNNLIANTNL